MHKPTRVSFVIPVYNEADRIADCLRAIAAQTVEAYEVIVVDNNSTDTTTAIASAFPFVRLLSEKQQGVVYARDRGFNAARGEIVARIDADTLVPTGWVETLLDSFSEGDIDVVSGSVSYRDIVAPRLVASIDLFWRRRMARVLGRDVAMQGANMALRRSVWRKIRSEVCHCAGYHEDFDLSIHATAAGFTARFDERLRASVCYRQADYDFRAFSHYALISPRTYLAHGVRSGRKMYQVVAIVIALYPIVSVLSRGYDDELGRFSIYKLFGAAVPCRVNPATFVD